MVRYAQRNLMRLWLLSLMIVSCYQQCEGQVLILFRIKGCEQCDDDPSVCQKCMVSDGVHQFFLQGNQCSSCLQGLDYFLNSTNDGCSLCENIITGCIRCEVGEEGTQCAECSPNRDGVQFAKLDDPATCQPCDSQGLLTYLNSAGDACVPCPNAISQCVSCTVGPTQTLCEKCFPYSNGLFLQFYLNDQGKCESCPDEQYLSLNMEGCDLCQNIIENCQECGGSPSGTHCIKCFPNNEGNQYALIDLTCTKCSEGLFLSLNGASCELCSDVLHGCKTCLIGAQQTECTQCEAKVDNIQFVLIESRCVPCDASSLQYRNDAGTSCLACAQIIPNCLSCSISSQHGRTICDQCPAFLDGEQYAVSPDQSSCDKCSDEDKFLFNGGCVACGSIVLNCATCAATEEGTICSVCTKQDGDDQYYLQNDLQCTICPGGSYLDRDLRGCSACSTVIPDCQACTAGQQGTQCTACIKDAENSLQYALVNPTTCTRCVKDTTYLALDGASCLPCVEANPNCQTCGVAADGTTECLECMEFNNGEQFFQDVIGSMIVCSGCEDDYMNNVNTCVACDQVINNCESCSKTPDGTKCVQCKPLEGGIQYFLDGEECESCPDGQFLVDAYSCGTCEAALVGCTSCSKGSEGTECSQCRPLNDDEDTQYFLDEKVCKYCTDNQYLQLGGLGCTTCSQAISNCQTCERKDTGTICSLCGPNNLNEHYYLQSDTQCSKCSGTYFYYKAINDCQSCDNIISNCASCYRDGAQTKCKYCKSVFEDGEFKSYQLNDDQTQCIKCDPGKYVAPYDEITQYEQKCKECDQIWSNCEICNVSSETSGAECKKCKKAGPESPNSYQEQYEQNYDNGYKQCHLCTDQWLQPDSSDCKPCQDIQGFQYCAQCQVDVSSGDTTCSQCDKQLAAYYDPDDGQCAQCENYLNRENTGCDECSIIIPDCSQCKSTSDGTKCAACKQVQGSQQFALSADGLSCSECTESEKYLNADKNDCVGCADAITGCTECKKGAQGTTCATCSAKLNNKQYALKENTCLECSQEVGSQTYMNVDGDDCLPCVEAIPGCASCIIGDAGTECDVCEVYIEHDGNKIQYELKSPTECTPCGEQYLDSDNDQCVACGEVIDKCVTCEAGPLGTICKQCDTIDGIQYAVTLDDLGCAPCSVPAFGMDSSNKCALCGVAIPGCLSCIYSKCNQCGKNVGGAQYANDGKGCQLCQDPQFMMNNQSGCDICSVVIPGCTDCQIGETATQCTVCSEKFQEVQYYLQQKSCVPCELTTFLNDAKTDCLPCGEAIIGCQACSAGQESTVCDACAKNLNGLAFVLEGENCKLCEAGTFLNKNNDACVSCADAINGCVSCTVTDQGTECLECARYLDGGQYILENKECTMCGGQQPFLNDLGTLCVTCQDAIDGCVACYAGPSSTLCWVCQPFYNDQQTYLVDNSCTGPCPTVNEEPTYLNYNFFLGISPECQACQEVIAGCLSCTIEQSGFTACASCNSNQDGLQFSLQSFQLGEQLYLNGCVLCELAKGEYLSQAGEECLPCIQAIPGCLSCVIGEQATQCLQCSKFFESEQYALIGNTCTKCIPDTEFLTAEGDDCLSCVNAILGCKPSSCVAGDEGSTCDDCDEDQQYYINEENTCTACIGANDQWLNKDGDACVSCEAFTENCVSCQAGVSGTQCTACDASVQAYLEENNCPICENDEGFWLLTATSCGACSDVITHCSQCAIGDEGTICSKCQDPTQQYQYSKIDDLNCVQCDNQNGDWLTLNGLTCGSCGDNIPGCLTCTRNDESQTICEECNADLHYHMTEDNYCSQCEEGKVANEDNTGCLSCHEAMLGCQKCASYNICSECNEEQDYFVNEGNTCSKCSLSGCTDCTSLEVCEQCDNDENYFLNNDVCQKCSLTACLDCESLTKCTICNIEEDYFLDEDVCKKCDLEGCLDCDSLVECVTCNTGIDYFLQDNICKKCDLEGCLDCESLTECKTCNNEQDYFLNGGICEKCDITGCLDCSSLSSCEPESCYTSIDYYYDESTLVCQIDCKYPCKTCLGPASACLSCVVSYALSGYTCISMHAGGTGSVKLTDPDTNAEVAAECPGGCALCSEPTVCDTCGDGYLLVDEKCVNCPVNCMVCDGGDSCAECYPGTVQDDSGDCVACPSNCEHCSTQSCTTCLKGFFVGQEGECQPCEQNCIACDDADTCTECGLRHALSTDGSCIECMSGCASCDIDDYTSCSGCLVGYFKEDSKCVRCSLGCSKCKAENYCQQCSGGYSINDATLTCHKTCEYPCYTCQDGEPTVCLSCYAGFQLANNKCQLNVEDCNTQRNCQYCPRTYVLTVLSTCETCGFSDCDFCDLEPTKICTQCSNGYYLDESAQCQECPAGCSSCKSQNFCSVCDSGYFMVENEEREPTGQCQPCSAEDFCKECQHSANQCSVCEDGYEFVDLKCASKKRIKLITKFSGVFSRFAQAINDIKDGYLEMLGQKYKGKRNLFTITKLEEGSVDLEGQITVDKDDTAENAFNRLYDRMKNSDEIAGWQVESSKIRRMNYSKPTTEEPEEVNIAIFIIIPIVLVVMILVIVIVLRMTRSSPEERKDLGESGKDLEQFPVKESLK